MVLWLLDPLIKQLQNVVHDQTDFSPFMWEPKPEEDWAVDEDDDEAMEDEDGKGDEEWSDDGKDDTPRLPSHSRESQILVPRLSRSRA